MQPEIGLLDLLLLPVYIGLFYLLIKKQAETIADESMRRIFFTAFGLRMLGSVLYSLVVVFYYGYGDSYTYYYGSDFLLKQVLNNPSNAIHYFSPAPDFQRWYMMTDGSNLGLSGHTGNAAAIIVMKLTSIAALLSFNRFLLMGLFFGLFSFAGQWKLFQVFDHSNQGRHRSLMALAVLYSPSIWFWGSGILKDSLCIGCTGFIVYTVYKAFAEKKFRKRYWLLLPLFVYLLTAVKSYITAVLLASLAVTLFFSYAFIIKNILLRIAFILSFAFVMLGMGLAFNISTIVNDLVEDSYMQIQSFQHNYQAVNAEDESSQAAVDFGEIDGSLGSLVMKGPWAIFTCLYRPFLWESRKIVILFTSLESFLLLLSTLYLLFMLRIIGFFRACFRNRMILYSLIASLLFALIIGFTTFNFGTMIRYKIILLPFYYFMLVAIYTYLTEQQKRKSLAQNVTIA